MNRVVQQLRSDALITWHGRVLTVNDWDGLVQAGEFDPAYLHLAPQVTGAPPGLTLSALPPPLGAKEIPPYFGPQSRGFARHES